VTLVGQWRDLQPKLPDGWSSAALRLQFDDADRAERAAALLGPAQPFRAERTLLRFRVARDGSAVGPDALTRLLRRVDDAQLGGALTLGETARAPERVQRATTSLATAWEAALAGLPADWSDVYAEVELTSTDFLERAAVLCVQTNPRRDGNRAAFHFRCARRSGYGVSPEMARRCFERCDAEKITGTVRVLRVLCDSRLVSTQGPVWMVGGRNV